VCTLNFCQEFCGVSFTIRARCTRLFTHTQHTHHSHTHTSRLYPCPSFVLISQLRECLCPPHTPHSGLFRAFLSSSICVSTLGCREVGFYCDTWGKHYSQLILPKNLDQSRQFRRNGTPFRRTATRTSFCNRGECTKGTELNDQKSLNLENCRCIVPNFMND
jgi:hypothetical protein